jgi:cytochrome P450
MVECGEAFINILDEHASAKRVFRLEEEVCTLLIVLYMLMARRQPIVHLERWLRGRSSTDYLQSTKVTIDVIGKVICDHDFKTLTTDNEFVSTMRKILTWLPDQQSMNPLDIYNPLRPIMLKYYKSRMDRYIGQVLDERFAVRDAKEPKHSRRKTGIDLALEEYARQNGQEGDVQHAGMDAEFRTAAIHNLLILLFAGHDTTASTLCYWYV